MRADLDGFGDKSGQISIGEDVRVVDDFAPFTVRPALSFAHNVLIAHCELFDLDSGQAAVEMSVSVFLWHVCLLGSGPSRMRKRDEREDDGQWDLGSNKYSDKPAYQ
ncbi:hypothetical protein MAHJHV65_21370 [Mycobacterium avium subsp. hominissuis]